MGMLASAGRFVRVGMAFLVLAVGLGGCAMPKSIPNLPTPLPIEVWQSTPTFVRRAEIADVLLIA